MEINAELKAFLESDVDIFVGSHDGHLRPSMIRAWGARVHENGSSVEFFLDMPGGAQTVANLRSNGRIAATFTYPVTMKTVQLKGRCIDIGDPHAGDWQWIARHRNGFAETVGYYGYPAHIVRNLWSMQVTRVRFTVEEAFNQTPGPGAGGKL